MKFFRAVVFCLIASLHGELPEIVAYAGEVPIRRERILAVLSPEACRNREAVRRVVEGEWNLVLLSRILTEEPSEESAKRYIDFRVSQVPESGRAAFREKLGKLISRKDFQLKSALLLQFLREVPAALYVSDDAIEEFYRMNRERFRTPGRADFSIMRVGRTGRESAERLPLIRARLLQGEPFDSVAAAFDPAGNRKVAPPDVALKLRFELEKMKEQEFRSISSSDGVVYLVRMNRGIPPSFVPLEEAAPFIREELTAPKFKEVLENRMILERRQVPLRLNFE